MYDCFTGKAGYGVTPSVLVTETKLPLMGGAKSDRSRTSIMFGIDSEIGPL